MQTLNPKVCRQARLSRDPRFDGEFFLAVTTTGIYCRPVCPARPPRENNVRYFRSAAAAAGEGFRPCLRCRPESAPDSPAWRGTSTTVNRALKLIGEGFLNNNSLAALASRLGVGERYLRKLFERHLGASPIAVAQTRRLHLARKLLHETSIDITNIAYASGFGSIRRFNDAMRAAFGCSPGELRQTSAKVRVDHEFTLDLSYRPPYDWDGVLDFFARHAVAGLESVADGRYQRNLLCQGQAVRIRVSPHPKRPVLRLNILADHNASLMPIVACVRRMFDLDAQPRDIADHLSTDPLLRPLLSRWPGVRSPVVSGLFECCVRAILGQQISIGAARNLCAKIAAACDHRVEVAGQSLLFFPRAAQLLSLADADLPMPGARRDTLRQVCELFLAEDGCDQDALLAVLASRRGIGPWTTEMVRMRGYGDPDGFPLSDLGLMKSCPQLKVLTAAKFRQRTQAWAPWRSYAANILWRNLCHEHT